MKQQLKHILLTTAKYTGVFALCRRLTANKLRILCYHGISVEDEHVYDPKLFMSPELFAERMRWLQERGYPILPLSEGVSRLQNGSLPPYATCITFDDGFYGALTGGAQPLHAMQLPATFYVCTNDVLRQRPIPELLLRYILWKATLGYTKLATCSLGSQTFSVQGKESCDELYSRVLEYAATMTTGEASEAMGTKRTGVTGETGETGRAKESKLALVLDVATGLGLNPQRLLDKRFMSLITPEELEQFYAYGHDVQLHTHHHIFPPNADSQKEQLTLNKQALEEITEEGRTFEHFCYPSNQYHSNSPAVLQSLGIKSATTCDAHLNAPTTSPHMLGRFLDGEHISMLDLEAFMCGFRDILKRMLP